MNGVRLWIGPQKNKSQGTTQQQQGGKRYNKGRVKVKVSTAPWQWKKSNNIWKAKCVGEIVRPTGWHFRSAARTFPHNPSGLQIGQRKKAKGIRNFTKVAHQPGTRASLGSGEVRCRSRHLGYAHRHIPKLRIDTEQKPSTPHCNSNGFFFCTAWDQKWKTN